MQAINLVNFWKHDDINAGDDLLMYVEDRPYVEYVLSHHPKCMKKQVFTLFLNLPGLFIFNPFYLLTLKGPVFFQSHCILVYLQKVQMSRS